MRLLIKYLMNTRISGYNIALMVDNLLMDDNILKLLEELLKDVKDIKSDISDIKQKVNAINDQTADLTEILTLDVLTVDDVVQCL